MITLRWYQEAALAAVYDYFLTKQGNPLIGLPTGTGKSVLPAAFIQRVMMQWPNQRFLLITHVKELIEQNLDVLKAVWPNAPVGVYSAGLKQRDTALPIIYGGVASMYKNPAVFGHRDIAFVDEAHLISQDESSMYQNFFKVMRLINPYLKIIGMSATLYRMGQGYITDGGLFTDIAFDMTSMEGFNRLVAEGYLVPPIPLRTKTELDVSNVSVNNGEFVAGQLQKAVDKNEITYAGLRELVDAGQAQSRRSWLLFASGIEHAEHIASMLATFGVECAAVHSKQDSDYNDRAIKAFKNFELRSIVNYGKLTTGFNHPAIDLIGMFRPTLSVPLWCQMIGRGTRPAEGKRDCLVLDFARNTPRLGPINDPVIPKKKGEGGGDAPIKLCEVCGAYNHAKVRFCCQCGAEFNFAIKIVAKAGTEELVRTDTMPVFETFPVTYAVYAKRQKKDKEGNFINKPYIKATYFCGMQSFAENVFPEHGGYATKLFHNWWKQRHTAEPPQTTDEALQFISSLRTPKTIRVHINKRYPEIISAEY